MNESESKRVRFRTINKGEAVYVASWLYVCTAVAASQLNGSCMTAVDIPEYVEPGKKNDCKAC